ncbi:hypothetical protein [Sphingomonas sp. KR3-1]|uniref:hypothetical protein n=1 Tax=Sphingomonas sp. KR3-1 TaxID=3156611 RepID=UPI0032B3B16D
MRELFFYTLLAVSAVFGFASIVGLVIWRSGFASYSMRRDIAQIWQMLSELRAGMLAAIGALALPLLIWGTANLFVGLDQQRWEMAATGGGMLAAAAVLIALLFRNA